MRPVKKLHVLYHWYALFSTDLDWFSTRFRLILRSFTVLSSGSHAWKHGEYHIVFHYMSYLYIVCSLQQDVKKSAWIEILYYCHWLFKVCAENTWHRKIIKRLPVLIKIFLLVRVWRWQEHVCLENNLSNCYKFIDYALLSYLHA